MIIGQLVPATTREYRTHNRTHAQLRASFPTTARFSRKHSPYPTTTPISRTLLRLSLSTRNSVLAWRSIQVSQQSHPLHSNQPSLLHCLSFTRYLLRRGSFPHPPPRPHASRQSAGTAAKIQLFSSDSRGGASSHVSVNSVITLPFFIFTVLTTVTEFTVQLTTNTRLLLITRYSLLSFG
jgi:hypothetical protein